jgi:hypothetical protein
MKKSLFNYSDWFTGKVYLETCASVIPKKILAAPTKVNSTQFSTYNFKKIQSKQKEIFNKSSTDLLKKFKKTFNERYKKSATKVLFLKREIDDNRKILFKKPIQDIKFLNRNFSISAIDIESMRDFIETQIIKGDEYFGFVHSPKFKYPNEKFTNDVVYAKVTFHYYNWLMKFYNNLKRSLTVVKETKNEIIDKKKVRVNVKVIALIYFYNGNQINRKNCQEIASLYGYNEINSGEGLFQDYTKFIKIIYRTKTNDESKVKCNYRLGLIKIAISHLKGKEKENAEKDYKILENAIDYHDWRF